MKKWNIGWGIVSSCNMNCKFCYSRYKRENSKDLELSDWLHFIDENHEYINTINYGTGENSISDDWFTFISYVRINYPEIKQAVTTNGYISEQMEKDPQKKKIVIDAIDEMDISLDFCNKEKHNEFRGQNKAYQWALSTLKFCSDYDKRPTIVCLGSKVNMYEKNLDGIFDIAKMFNALVRINLYRPTEGINSFSEQFILAPEKLVHIIQYIASKYEVLSISDSLLSNLLTDKAESDPSGIDSIRILSDGSITPSTYLIDDEYNVGNITQSYILKKLTHDKSLENIIYDIIPEECKGCKYSLTCKGGVYDRRLLWYKTLNNKDPYCIYEPGKQEIEKIDISNETFESVHHGYLPTLFFKNKECVS